MTPSQLEAILTKAGLSQSAAARLLRVQPRTVRRWLAGDREIPFTAAALLKFIAKGTLTIKQVEDAK